MKTIGRLSLIFLAAAALAVVSCEESIPSSFAEDEPYIPVDPVLSDCGDGCHTLVHHAAVIPTANTSGNIEHWHCEKCHLNFLDEQGTRKMTLSPYLRATNHEVKAEILAFKRGSFPWSSKVNSNVGTKGISPLDAIKSGVSILSGVMSIACSIQKLIRGSEEDHTEEYFNQIMEGLDGISGAVSDVNSRTQLILGAIKDAPYQDYIDKTNNEIRFIWDYTKDTYDNIKLCMELYKSGEWDEAAFNDEVVNLLKDWAARSYEGETMPNIVTTRLAEFGAVSVAGSKKSFPQVNKEYCKSYSVFDHQVYDDRAGLNRYVEFVLSAAYYIDQLARTCDAIKYHSSLTHYKDSVKFRGYLEDMKTLVEQDSVNMNKAYENYRVFRNCSDESVIYIKNKAITADFFCWLRGNGNKCWFPGDNYEGKLITNLDRMWTENTGLSATSNDVFLLEDFNDIYMEYNPYGSSTHVSLYSIIRDTALISNVKGYEESVSTKYGDAKNYFLYWQSKEEINSGDRDYYDRSLDYTHESNDYRNVFYYHNNKWNSGGNGCSIFRVETCVNDNAQIIQTEMTHRANVNKKWYKDSSYNQYNKDNYGIYYGESYTKDPATTIYTVLERYTGTIYD